MISGSVRCLTEWLLDEQAWARGLRPRQATQWGADACTEKSPDRSIHRQPGGFDRRGVLFDLAHDKFLQISGRATLGRDGDGADLLESLLHGRRIHRRDGRVMKLLDDRLRRALWEEESEPGRRLEVEPLLPGGGEVRHHGGALAREDGNRLDERGVDLRLGRRTQRAEVIDAAGNQILNRRPS